VALRSPTVTIARNQYPSERTSRRELGRLPVGVLVARFCSTNSTRRERGINQDEGNAAGFYTKIGGNVNGGRVLSRSFCRRALAIE
jgi:hypothetical protein